eukprot:766076-Hanusia_phi.AAC.1
MLTKRLLTLLIVFQLHLSSRTETLQKCRRAYFRWQTQPFQRARQERWVQLRLRGGSEAMGIRPTATASIESVREVSQAGYGAISRRVLELSLSFSNELEYQPGDCIGVVCPNPPDLVLKLLDLLHARKAPSDGDVGGVQSEFRFPETYDESARVRVRKGMRADMANQVMWGKDLTSPSKKLLRSLASVCEDDADKLKLTETAKSQKKFEEEVVSCKLDVVEVIEKFGSCKLELHQLLEMLPPQSPRYYSLSTSPLSSGGRRGKILVAVCENVMEREDKPESVRRRGLCSGYLEDLSLMAQNNSQRICFDSFLRKSDNFQLPPDPSTPLMLVGFGTGIAPFLGFLEHRAEQRRRGLPTGDVYVVVSCRSLKIDFLHHRKLLRMVSEQEQEQEQEQEEKGSARCLIREIHAIGSRDIPAGVLIFKQRKRKLEIDPGAAMKEAEFECPGDVEKNFHLIDKEGRLHVQDIVKDYMGGWVVKQLCSDLGSSRHESAAPSSPPLCLFVCGDNNVAKSFQMSLVDVMTTLGKCSTRGEALREMKRLIEAKRYLQDIWGDSLFEDEELQRQDKGRGGGDEGRRIMQNASGEDRGSAGSANLFNEHLQAEEDISTPNNNSQKSMEAFSPGSNVSSSNFDAGAGGGAGSGVEEEGSGSRTDRAGKFGEFLPTRQYRRLKRAMKGRQAGVGMYVRREKRSGEAETTFEGTALVSGSDVKVEIFFATRTGHAESLAQQCAKMMEEEMKVRDVRVRDLSEHELQPEQAEALRFFFVSSWDDGQPCSDARPFFRWLSSSSSSSSPFPENFPFAICGLGSSSYKSSYQRAAHTLCELLEKHGGRRIGPVGEEDEMFAGQGFQLWCQQTLPLLREEVEKKTPQRTEEGAMRMLRVLWQGDIHGLAARIAGEIAERTRGGGGGGGGDLAAIAEPLDRFDAESLSSEEAVVLVLQGPLREEGEEDGGNTTMSSEAWLIEHLRDCNEDERVDKSMLAQLLFGVVVVDNSNQTLRDAKLIDFYLFSLSARRVLPVTRINRTRDVRGQVEQLAQRLRENVSPRLPPVQPSREGKWEGGNSEKRSSAGDAVRTLPASTSPPDIEDMGRAEEGQESTAEMLSPTMRLSLEKQGYRVVGSHSGVKLCRC